MYAEKPPTTVRADMREGKRVCFGCDFISSSIQCFQSFIRIGYPLDIKMNCGLNRIEFQFDILLSLLSVRNIENYARNSWGDWKTLSQFSDQTRAMPVILPRACLVVKCFKSKIFKLLHIFIDITLATSNHPLFTKCVVRFKKKESSSKVVKPLEEKTYIKLESKNISKIDSCADWEVSLW